MLQTRSCRHGGTRACHPAVGGITQGRGAHYKRFTSGSLFAGPANSSLRRHQPGPPPAVHCRHRRRRGAARDSRTVLLFTATRWTNIYFAGFSDPIVRPGCTRAAVAHSGTAPAPRAGKRGCSILRTAGRTWPRRRFARTAARPRPSCCHAPCRAAAARGRSPGARAAWPARSPARPGTRPPCTARTSSPCPCLPRARGHHAEPEPGAKFLMSPL